MTPQPKSSRQNLLSLSSAVAAQQAKASTDPKNQFIVNWSEIQSEINRGDFWRNKLGCIQLPGEIDDFPITEYDDYRSTLEGHQREALSPLTDVPVLWWAMSSGTSGGKRKLFPVTDLLASKRKIRRLLSLHRTLGLLRNDSPEFLELRFGGIRPQYDEISRIPIGHMTAFERECFGEFRNYQVLPPQVFSDLSAFDEWSSIYALGADLTSITTVTPSKLVWMLRDIETNLEKYMNFLSEKRAVPRGFPKIRTSANRLQVLQKALKTQSITVSDLWPSLQLVYTWKTASGRFLVNDLRRFLNSNVKLLQGHFISSESDFSLPSNDPSCDFGPLNLLYGIIEFLEIGSPVESRNLKKSWELEVGRDYEIFVTNVMGLFIYIMRDVICCRGYEGSNPLIEFKQKLDSYIDLESCRIHYSQLADALGEAKFRSTGRWIFLPSKSRKNLIFLGVTDCGLNSAMLSRIDEELQGTNADYRKLRLQRTLGYIENLAHEDSEKLWSRFPAVHAESKPPVMRNQTYDELMDRKGF